MFSGIIKNKGRVSRIDKKNKNCFLEISSTMIFKKKDIGSSISCSGACLTLENFSGKICKFFVSNETLNRTIFKKIQKGEILNLEKPLKHGTRNSGHFVQGHVDTTSKISKITKVGKSWLINFILEKRFMKFIVEKGSISINGVSLTISNINRFGFSIIIVPHTLKLTNLIFLKKNDFVNIEFDVLGKYIKNFLK
jgi:riboflavin synthase